MKFKKLHKLKKGYKIAIISPSFSAPAIWPDVFELGLENLKKLGLIPEVLKYTSKLGASGEERMEDIHEAFSNPKYKAVMATLGGNDQVTYIKYLNKKTLEQNPKPFFGFSDNSHLQLFLWGLGIKSYYGASLFTQLCSPQVDEYTLESIEHSMFDTGQREIVPSKKHCEYSVWEWDDINSFNNKREYIDNPGYFWDGENNGQGILWGGCLESIDEILRHRIELPSLKDFEDVVLFFETSEKRPTPEYVHRVLRALGCLGILERVNGLLVGRPDTGLLDPDIPHDDREKYREEQRRVVLDTFREYNKTSPVVQNMDFGHTHPQFCVPNGGRVLIDPNDKRIIL